MSRERRRSFMACQRSTAATAAFVDVVALAN